jgi:hypothetical protein
MVPASGDLFELFYFFIMLSKKLWTLHEVVIFIGPAFRARGFSGGVGLTLPSTSMKSANLPPPSQCLESHHPLPSRDRPALY